MKVSALQENFKNGLNIVGRAVATRTTLPITQNVLLATDGGRLKISATNLEIAITTWIGGKVEEEGSIAIPARLLTELVNTLPEEQIDIVSVPKSNAIELHCARFEARINGADPDEFPPIPSVQDGVAIKIEANVLRKAIAQVAFAAATEESRPVLTGIKVELEGQQFTFAAADGFRLAVKKGPLSEPMPDPVSVIVPARTLLELNRLLGDQQEPVEVMVTPAKSQILFRIKNGEMVSQLVQGTFPNYAQLIPENYTTRVVAGLQEFLQATRTAAIIARDGSGIVRVQMQSGNEDSRGKILISSQAEEIGENRGEFDARVEGVETKIAFNSKYLLDVLSVMEKGDIVLEATGSSSPGVFKPSDEAESDYVHVVMPMFVQEW